MTREQLLERIAVKQSEDGFTERKRGVAEDDVVPTLVAFANSVPLDREAVLFVGVDRTGKPHGVQNADESQRKIGRWIGQCYPPIKVETTVLSIDGVEILALVVRASDDRPTSPVQRGCEKDPRLSKRPRKCMPS
jgi:predicted HTH transcriptional regulator